MRWFLMSQLEVTRSAPHESHFDRSHSVVLTVTAIHKRGAAIQAKKTFTDASCATYI